MSVAHTEVTPLIEPCGLPEHTDCGIRDVLDRFGERWSVLLIVELASGPRRFRELQRGVHGISQRMLTLSLRRLERDGLVARTAVPTVPVSVSYDLTGLGRSLTRLIKQLADWSLEHRDAIAEARRRWSEANPEPSRSRR
jgi:DNA-binding HxlR family transcriptional regulator